MAEETPRAYTPEEIVDKLMWQIWDNIEYWEHVEGCDRTVRDRMSGLIHSVLAALDGCVPGLPAFLVTPMPHPENETYHREQGENWFPSDQPDLGMLHEVLYQYDPHRLPTLKGLKGI